MFLKYFFTSNFNNRELEDFVSFLSLVEGFPFGRNSSNKRTWVGNPSGEGWEFSCNFFFMFSVVVSFSSPTLKPFEMFWIIGIPLKVLVFA